MNWFAQNRFLGTFLAVFGFATLGAVFFLWSARSGFAEAKARFDQNAAELNRLEHLTPFPTEANLREMKSHAENYNIRLNDLKEDLKGRVLPVVPMAPNEFQSRLRQALTGVADKARGYRVKLPANFFLGFDEYAAALPDTAATPLLGQQLAQVELLLNIMLDARVDAISSLRRVAPPDAAGPAASASATPSARKPPASAVSATPTLVERSVIEVSFVASPGASRRVLNQIAAANQQFYITRTLHVLNEKDVGPPREAAAAALAGLPVIPPAPGTAASTTNSALNFIVGTERIQTSARIRWCGSHFDDLAPRELRSRGADGRRALPHFLRVFHLAERRWVRGEFRHLATSGTAEASCSDGESSRTGGCDGKTNGAAAMELQRALGFVRAGEAFHRAERFTRHAANDGSASARA